MRTAFTMKPARSVFPSHIRATLRLSSTRWGAMGCSSGGYCAGNLFSQTPQPIQGRRRDRRILHADPRRVRRAAVPGRSSTEAANDPFLSVRTPHSLPAFSWVPVLGDRESLAYTTQFAAAVDRRAHPVVLTEAGARHDYPAWGNKPSRCAHSSVQRPRAIEPPLLSAADMPLMNRSRLKDEKDKRRVGGTLTRTAVEAKAGDLVDRTLSRTSLSRHRPRGVPLYQSLLVARTCR
jgi:hypothetical protein